MVDYIYELLKTDITCDNSVVIEKSTFFNRHNATAIVDELVRKEYYITFNTKHQEKVDFSKSFMGAFDSFVKRECSAGKPIPINRWRMLPGHIRFENEKWWNQNKDRKVAVWTYWTAAGVAGNILLNPVTMQVLDPMDYRVKAEEHHTYKAHMSIVILSSVVHKANALLTM